MKLLVLITLGLSTFTAAQTQVLNFAGGNALFTADVYKEMLKTNTGNFMVSPLSAEIILALANTGAGGRTARQLSSGLHLPENSEEIRQIFGKLSPNLKTKPNQTYTINTANKMYVKNGLNINSGFKNSAVETFNAEIENIDFANAEQAALEINRWVEQKTQNKIQNLISTDDLHEDILTVLVNAIYFQGNWTTAFDHYLTKKNIFYVNKLEQAEVETMERDSYFNVYENSNLNAKYLKLPYQGNDVTMTIVLPNEIDGLADLEARISDVFKTPAYKERRLDVKIPKFKIETTIQLKSILQALGVTDAFEDVADFNQILVNQPFKISKVIQKTFIEIHEEGTEASAATGAFGVFLSEPDRLAVDHPFLFYIKYKDIILFVGRYTSPNA